MKTRAHILEFLLAALLLVVAVGPLPLFAAPPPQNDKLEIRQSVSVFIYPNNASEGRDPFFPGSTHVYSNNPDKQISGPALTDLILKSILGTPPRVFAIINNHTFAVGDDGDVITKMGQRLHIRCVDINLKAGTATVEANGMSEVLHLSGGQ
jgi:hypothetical protein